MILRFPFCILIIWPAVTLSTGFDRTFLDRFVFDEPIQFFRGIESSDVFVNDFKIDGLPKSDNFTLLGNKESSSTKPLSRQKRFLGALSRITANLITGCGYYPSICEMKKELGFDLIPKGERLAEAIDLYQANAQPMLDTLKETRTLLTDMRVQYGDLFRKMNGLIDIQVALHPTRYRTIEVEALKSLIRAKEKTVMDTVGEVMYWTGSLSLLLAINPVTVGFYVVFEGLAITAEVLAEKAERDDLRQTVENIKIQLRDAYPEVANAGVESEKLLRLLETVNEKVLLLEEEAGELFESLWDKFSDLLARFDDEKSYNKLITKGPRCEDTIQLHGFCTGNGVYKRTADIAGGRSIYRQQGGSGVLAFDPKYRHWWVQDQTFEPGKDQGFAWLEDPSYCPELGFSPHRFNCEISGLCQRWQQADTSREIISAFAIGTLNGTTLKEAELDILSETMESGWRSEIRRYCKSSKDFNDFDQCFDEYHQQMRKMAAGHTFSKVALEKVKRINKHVNETVKPAFKYSFQGLLDSDAYSLSDLIDISKSISTLVKQEMKIEDIMAVNRLEHITRSQVLAIIKRLFPNRACYGVNPLQPLDHHINRLQLSKADYVTISVYTEEGIEKEVSWILNKMKKSIPNLTSTDVVYLIASVTPSLSHYKGQDLTKVRRCTIDIQEYQE